MPRKYTDYMALVKEDVSTCLADMACQPILFIGSGVSARYFNAPNWKKLLEYLAGLCPEVTKDFAYYLQSCNNDLPEVGEIFADRYREWAWGSGRTDFPDNLFKDSVSPQIYIKYKVCQYLHSITPTIEQIMSNGHSREIESLKSIQPHAIITTNYDQFTETTFPEYHPIVGQKILRTNYEGVGEILKIHGCVSDPESIVLTKSDYLAFDAKKKYLSAKLLTYFAEHPLLFVGYSAEDPNIRNILSDIDEIIAAESKLIPNIYILEWNQDLKDSDFPPTERVICVSNRANIRVKSITASSFEWVYKAFATNQPFPMINPKLLRGLLARTYNLVRHDIPRRSIEVDFRLLEHAIIDNDGLAKLYGIARVADSSVLNAQHPYLLSTVAEKLGYSYWYYADLLIKKIKAKKNVDIKASDNRYHVAIKYGRGQGSKIHKYSDELVVLLEKVQSGLDYVVILD